MISSLPLQSSDNTQRIELEYGWELLVDRSGRMTREQAENASGWRSARVGLSWNVQFEDLRVYMGAAWYRLRFELLGFRDTRHVLLKFGAVDYFCEVFINGVLVGSHEGGYTPFSFEITTAVHSGENEMLVRVVDPPMDEVENRALFPEMMYNEIPHGKQNWYVQNSGIWQGVRIELCPSLYIERIDVVPKVTGELEILARLAGVALTAEKGAILANETLYLQIHDTNGRRVFEQRTPLDSSSHNVRICGMVSSPRLWSPENPALYILEAELSGPVRYRRRARFGFRSFDAREGKLYLNGKPFQIIGALDQDFYPETIHTPTSLEYVRDMMSKAKRLGINLLRCHLKVAHPVYLNVADELGMLIWTELPSWSDAWFPSDHFSNMAAIRADRMFWEILIRDWNHCCIVIQSIMNESWGINLDHASQREWLRGTFDRIKELLRPLGRLVVDNSACEGNFHIKTDIEDFHQYYSMPDHMEKWDKWLAELASRPNWTFSPYGDAVRTGQEPLLVSEFGNWGLPKLPQEQPWWFEVSFGERGVTRPAGVLNRFHEYGFDTMFESFNDLAEETQRHQFISLKYEIESIRSYQALQGYVITGVTDVHWEVNGLLDMWRNEKLFANELSAIQRPDVIACRLPSFDFYSGQALEIPLFISHFSSVDLNGARVRWSTNSGETGSFVITCEIKPGSVTHLPPIRLSLPKVEAPVQERLEIEVRLRNSHRIAENYYDLFVMPHKAVSKQTLVHVHEMPPLSAAMDSAGYAVSRAEGVMIAGGYCTAVAERLQNGGRVLLLANSEDSLPADWPLKIASRQGTELDGRWFSNFNWIRTDRPPFASVAFTRILGFESARVAPTHVIQGLRSHEYADVLSGISYGWLNNNCALTVQARVGPGTMLITTFRFNEYGQPYATELLHSMLEYVAGQDCRPALELPLVVPVEAAEAK